MSFSEKDDSIPSSSGKSCKLEDERVKPNFIHSSDIPKKIALLIHSLSESKINNWQAHCQDHHLKVLVNVELNTLHTRCATRPKLDTLLQRNMISLAQRHHKHHRRDQSSDNNYLSVILKSKVTKSSIQPHALKTNDAFVVRFDLLITLISGDKVHFETNFDYGILKQYDSSGELVNELQRYVRCLFSALTEAKQQGKFKQEFIPPLMSEASDSTLECSGDEDYDCSYETESCRIEPLASNETLNEELRRRFSEISYNEEFATQKTKFLGSLNNLRHNEEDEEEEGGQEGGIAGKSGVDRRRNKKDTQNELYHQLASPLIPNSSENPFHLDDLIEVEYEDTDAQDADYFMLNPQNSCNSNAPPMRQFENDERVADSPRCFYSPTKSRKTISQMSSAHSLSLIDKDEKFGLEYAFNASDVPSFIKQDKKFKFIKVGKVQKFVDLFEKKQETEEDSRASSANGSRVNTRPGSPLGARPNKICT
ncbi:uncharacterized protein LODBEIA_P30070 [Lodderomyces beijingensis]|uniref:Telomere replication protein EST3 n=1 Tax=Lodderomyces beijingensis TaxID=1775926 RepID=A0ABP0ZKV6_9ASCO